MITALTSVGELLRGLRDDRGLSIRAVARGSGVSKSALSQWESHGRSPSIFELDQVLSALEAPSTLRLQAYALVDAPRGEVRLDEILFEGPASPSVLFGALLRAIRRRANLTQATVAQAVGVTQGAITRWESGDRRPDPQVMSAICRVIGASEAESEALSGWQPSLERLEDLLFPQTPDFATRIGLMLFHVEPDSEFALKDLRYAVIGARLWSDAGMGRSSPVLMANCLACYADHLHSRVTTPWRCGLSIAPTG